MTIVCQHNQATRSLQAKINKAKLVLCGLDSEKVVVSDNNFGMCTNSDAYDRLLFPVEN